MTIISRSHRFVFVKTRKTAGTSIENWLSLALRQGDAIATAPENPVRTVSFWDTPNSVTRWSRTERSFKRVVKHLPLAPVALNLREHMSAAVILATIGEAQWGNAYSFCVERDPWDRLISLWVWRQKRDSTSLSFDAFLDRVEAVDPSDRLVRGFSNLPLYTHNGRIIVSEIIPYSGLINGLKGIITRLGLPLDVMDLPLQKAGLRAESMNPRNLRPDQIDRIAAICRDEIALLGWDFGAIYSTE